MHNVAWICTYSNRLERIPTLQGQEHSWLWEGHSSNHESPSYKVHNHPQASIYIYIYTYIHTYIHTSCTMLACRHCHTLGMRPKQDTRKGNPSTWFHRRLKERERGRKRRPLREVRPPNLLNIALFGLASSCLHPYPFCSCLGSYILAPSVHMQW